MTDIVDNSSKFTELRRKYPVFHYRSFSFSWAEDQLIIDFVFEIEQLATFTPRLILNFPAGAIRYQDEAALRTLIFNVGLAELVSYWKSTCSPVISIDCAPLTQKQQEFWRKTYFLGLGEMFYRNNITTDEQTLLKFEAEPETSPLPASTAPDPSGYLIAIGGGKDSCVTLDTLHPQPGQDYAFIVNPSATTLACAHAAGLTSNNIITVERHIDPLLLELNSQGFLNGHTPFNTVLACLTTLAGTISNLKYLALSNESSANDPSIAGTSVNHQYSKSFEFETDFRAYSGEFLPTKSEYFSFLRPLNELQIAAIFSQLKAYHPIFKSCNVGSKGEPWQWCCHCGKCLFAYIILSPFLYPDELPTIFGTNLYENNDLAPLLEQLSGHTLAKPFDCVGTVAEVTTSLALALKRVRSTWLPVPPLLKYYIERYGEPTADMSLLTSWETSHHLTSDQATVLRASLDRALKEAKL